MLKVVQKLSGDWTSVPITNTDVTADGDWLGYTEMSLLEWLKHCDKPDNKFVNGKFVAGVALDLVARAAQVKQRELNQKYENFIQKVQPEYTPSERDTWAIQVEEARLLKTTPTTPAASVPLLAAIAAVRTDVTLAELATRVLNKFATWTELSGNVTGQRHCFQHQLDAASTVEAVEAIEITFVMPNL